MGNTENLLNIKTVSQLFEECAVSNSEKVAITHEEQKLNYRELNNQANLLAKSLKLQGVTTNTIIAIYMERSTKLIVSMLAVVKAGGTYLNLDINEANNRLALILNDSNPAKILVEKEDHSHFLQSIDSVSTSVKSNIVNINHILSEQNDQIENLTCINKLLDPICVFYTSGSTGTPKGCVITHQGISSLVKNTNYIHFSPDDSVAQISNPAFDAISFEVWGALLNGLCLKIISKEVLLSVVDFSQTIQSLNISIMFITTALLNSTLKNIPEAFDRIKHLLFGGEKANPQIVRELLFRKSSHNLKLKIVHVYGPTENTTFTTFFNVEKLEDINGYVPIGKSVTHTELYVLDEKLQPVACGITGELYIGGKRLALGYLNAPELTTKKFIDNPFKPGEKIYKTGDLVYFLPSGDLVFAGRMDNQVKIRGFRIELEEIERIIAKYPSIVQVAVVVESNKFNEKIIVAYVNFLYDAEIDVENFLRNLQENLPSYMFPSKIIQVDVMPLTPNGKIDKKNLNNLLGKNIYQLMVKDKPNTQLEEILCTIWQEELDIKEIGTRQNFFDLGAHSLMLAHICSSLNAKLNLNTKLVPMDLMTYPNIKALACYLSDHSNNSSIVISKDNINRAKHRRQLLLNRRKNE